MKEEAPVKSRAVIKRSQRPSATGDGLKMLEGNPSLQPVVMRRDSKTAHGAKESVDALHAKTHFSQLLERVAGGEEITITKHERPVARLVPADRRSHEDVATTFRRMDALRESLPKFTGKETLKELVAKGRRFKRQPSARKSPSR